MLVIVLFIEILLVVIFVGIFIITIKVIDVSALVKEGIVERLLLFQTINAIVITLLLLLNSFWMLYIFNEIIRTRSALKEINFNLSKRKPDLP